MGATGVQGSGLGSCRAQRLQRMGTYGGALGQLQSAVSVQPGHWLHAGWAYSSRCVTLGCPKSLPKWQRQAGSPGSALPQLGSGAGMNPALLAKGSERMARAELCAAAPSRLQQCEMHRMASPSSFGAPSCSQCPCSPGVL